MTVAQRDTLAVAIVRGYTAMCLYDQDNGLHYMKLASKYREDASIYNNIAYLLHTKHGIMHESLNHYMMGLTLDKTFDKIYSGAMAVADSLSLPYLRLAIAKKSTESIKDDAELLNGLGLAQLAVPSKDFVQLSRQSFDRALVLAKEKQDTELCAKIYLNLGHLYSVIGDTKESVQMYIKCIETKHHSKMAYSNLLLNLHYNKKLPDRFRNTQSLEQVHEELMQEAYPLSPPSQQAQQNDPMLVSSIKHWKTLDKPNSQQFCVGIISADFIGHAVSCFIQFLLKQSQHTFYLYSNTILNPTQVETLKPHQYRCIHEVPASIVVNTIIADKCTHVIDLSGHTAGNRTDVIALLSQYIVPTLGMGLFSYCGYPNDIGLRNLRRITDVESESTTLKNTANLYLNRFFLCYSPPSVYYDIPPKVHAKHPSLITLGCFCKLSKINQFIIDLWMRILKQYPQVRLVLKHKTFTDDTMRTKWKNRFAKYSHRVQFLESADSSDKHMQLYRAIDIHLDTYPYSSTTIAHECLFMNVPIVTLCRDTDRHVSKVTGSLLKHLGLTECIASSEDQYVEIIGNLINDPQRLGAMNVRDRLLNSVLMNKQDMLDHFMTKLQSSSNNSAGV